MRSVEFYHAATNKWTNGPNLPIRTADNMVATAGGRVYALGGKTGSTSHRAIYVLKADLSGWERFAVDLTANAAYGFRAVVYNDGE